jgi:hypothetical protein
MQMVETFLRTIDAGEFEIRLRQLEESQAATRLDRSREVRPLKSLMNSYDLYQRD